MTHVVRLRCARCGERVGWVDPGPVLLVEHHMAGKSFSTATKPYEVTQGLLVWWECVTCQHPLTLSARGIRYAASRGRRGKVPDVRVPLQRPTP